MSVYPSATPSQKRRKPALCQSSSRWLTHHAGATSGGPSPRISYATRRAPRGRNRISDFSSIAMSLRRPPEQRKNIRQRHSQLHPAQCLGYLLWCPDPYRTVNLVDIEPVRRGDLLRPRLSPPIERVTDAAVFDRTPTEPTLDAAGSGAGGSGGWIRGVPPARHIRLPLRLVYSQRHRERHRSVRPQIRGHGGLRPARHGRDHHLPRRDRPTTGRRRRWADLGLRHDDHP